MIFGHELIVLSASAAGAERGSGGTERLHSLAVTGDTYGEVLKRKLAHHSLKAGAYSVKLGVDIRGKLGEESVIRDSVQLFVICALDRRIGRNSHRRIRITALGYRHLHHILVLNDEFCYLILVKAGRVNDLADKRKRFGNIVIEHARAHRKHGGDIIDIILCGKHTGGSGESAESCLYGNIKLGGSMLFCCNIAEDVGKERGILDILGVKTGKIKVVVHICDLLCEHLAHKKRSAAVFLNSAGQFRYRIADITERKARQCGNILGAVLSLLEFHQCAVLFNKRIYLGVAEGRAVRCQTVSLRLCLVCGKGARGSKGHYRTVGVVEYAVLDKLFKISALNASLDII